jgi:hypothetical protein
LVPSLAAIPRDGASRRHNHRAPKVGYILRGHVAIEFDDGATRGFVAASRCLSRLASFTTRETSEASPQGMLSTYMVDEAQPLATSLG